MIPLIVLSLIIHFGDYYYVGYVFQRDQQSVGYVFQQDHQSMSSRFAAISPEDMGFWRHLCRYPKSGRNRGAYWVTYDIERLTILHQLFDLVLIAVLSLLSHAEVISPLTAFYIFLGNELTHSLVTSAVRQFGVIVFKLSENPVVPETEKKKHIRNCIRQYPEEKYTCKVQQHQENGLLWRKTAHILNVTDRETGELVAKQTILKEEWYRYLEGCITTFPGKES